METQSIIAAVAREKGAPLILEHAKLDSPREHEVLVRIAGTGICHTDLIVRDQLAPFPLPAVLGHEGAGIVERVGSGVMRVVPGDHVVLSFDSCGACVNCRQGIPAYCQSFYSCNFRGCRSDGSSTLSNGQDERIHGSFFGQSSFANFALASERSVVKIPRDVPLEIMGPLGCGIQTGAGAVLNALKPPPGSTIAVFGVGAVGMSAVMAARIAGCTQIIAVDRRSNRLDMALTLGATQIVNAVLQDPVADVRRLSGGAGVNFSLECTGVPAVLRSAFDVLAVPGCCGVVGAAPPDAEIALNIIGILCGRTIRGIIEGDSVPEVFIPHLIKLWREGQFPFDKLIRHYALDQINEAIRDSEHGNVLKSVVVPSPVGIRV